MASIERETDRAMSKNWKTTDNVVEFNLLKKLLFEEDTFIQLSIHFQKQNLLRLNTALKRGGREREKKKRWLDILQQTTVLYHVPLLVTDTGQLTNPISMNLLLASSNILKITVTDTGQCARVTCNFCTSITNVLNGCTHVYTCCMNVCIFNIYL